MLQMSVEPTANRAPVAQWIEHLTSDQMVGGSNPSGRAIFPRAAPTPILAEAQTPPFPEWRRPRQPMCQMPSPSARIVRCPPRPN